MMCGLIWNTFFVGQSFPIKSWKEASVFEIKENIMEKKYGNMEQWSTGNIPSHNI